MIEIDHANIFKTWDLGARQGCFPMLDNGYYYHADQKLTIFRDDTRWAILIELLQFNNHLADLEGIFTVAWFFKDGLITPKSNVLRPDFFEFAANADTEAFLQDETAYFSYLNPDAVSIKVKGIILPIPQNLSHYAAKGIEPAVQGKIMPWEFLRGLVPEHSHQFWLGPNEIADQIPTDLPVLLTLHDWHHPDIANREKPSASETFLQLLKVIETGDVTHYSPTKPANTHWKNWPGGGSL